MTVVTQYLKGLFSLFRLLRLLRLPDDVVNDLVAPGVDLLLGVPHVALGVVVLLDAKAVVDRLYFNTFTSSTTLMTSSWMNSFCDYINYV